LQDAGYVSARKAAQGGRQRTWLSLTRAGRKAFAAYVKTLEGLARIAQRAAE
jgi:DNA-binding PadR family transcriptional regulator